MLEQLGINAKKASANLAGASTELKNKALEAIANALVDNAQKIIDANKVDYNAQLTVECLTGLCLILTELRVWQTVVFRL